MSDRGQDDEDVPDEMSIRPLLIIKDDAYRIEDTADDDKSQKKK